MQEPTKARGDDELLSFDFGTPDMDGVNGNKTDLPAPSSACDAAKNVSVELQPFDFGAPGFGGVNGSKAGLPEKAFVCYTAENLRFSVLHIPKNAGSALRRFVDKILCASEGKELGCGVESTMGPCPRDASFFIFTFTRNPWARAVSMWSYGLKRLQLQTKDTWERIRIANKYCTFDQFIDNLAKNSTTDTCGFHVDVNQYDNIFMQDGRPGVHFAGRLEHFDRDFKTILKVLTRFRSLRAEHTKHACPTAC